MSYHTKIYLTCLKDKESNHHKCRELSKAYLQCRMDKKLMAEENLDEVGNKKKNKYYIVCLFH